MIRELVKTTVAWPVSRISPQCRYRQAIFIVAHMRCGSTALSNILCSRSDVSGYGECHVRYEDQASLGRLLVNQALRKEWSSGATYLFDKILHSRHDSGVPQQFYDARAIFVARQPGATIRSIRKLYRDIGRSDEYSSDTEAAEYYVERLGMMSQHWNRFDPSRRFGMTHAMLMRDPEKMLQALSETLSFSPPLENRYKSKAASLKGGAGDPTASAKFTKIQSRPYEESEDPIDRLDISDDLKHRCFDAYTHFARLLEEEPGKH